MKDNEVGDKKLLIARNNKRYRKIYREIWYMSEDEESNWGTSREADIEWGTRKAMDIFDSWPYY